MSFRNLTPLTGTALLYAQSGSVYIERSSSNVIGNHAGYSGRGTQEYTEILCGDQCGEYTEAHDSSGTIHLPNIEYIIAIKAYGVAGAALFSSEITAKSITGDHLSKDGSSYNPVISPSIYFRLYHGTEVFGKFNRVAIYKTSLFDTARMLLTKGPSIN